MFVDDIYNGLGVIVLTDTDKQTDRNTKSQTDNTEGNITLGARVVTC